MRELHRKLGSRIVILVVHQREPHAGQMAFREVEQPTTFEERRALAIRARDELQIPMTILVDGMDDASRAMFGDLPSPAFVVDERGVIRDKLPWADPERLQTSVEALLEPREADSRLQPPRPVEEAAEATPAARARALIALARARPADAKEAIDRAAAASRIAWRDNPARLVAALVELAELDGEGALWREALATLEARAPVTQRRWLEKRADAAKQTSSR